MHDAIDGLIEQAEALAQAFKRYEPIDRVLVLEEAGPQRGIVAGEFGEALQILLGFFTEARRQDSLVTDEMWRALGGEPLLDGTVRDQLAQLNGIEAGEPWMSLLARTEAALIQLQGQVHAIVASADVLRASPYQTAELTYCMSSGLPAGRRARAACDGLGEGLREPAGSGRGAQAALGCARTCQETPGRAARDTAHEEDDETRSQGAHGRDSEEDRVVSSYALGRRINPSGNRTSLSWREADICTLVRQPARLRGHRVEGRHPADRGRGVAR
jgi:hypothetical protein